MKTEREYAEGWFGRNSDALTDAQRRVVKSAVERQPVTRNTNEVFDESLSLSDRLSDNMARIGGSWRFIIGFCVLLLLWTLGNVWLATRAFDPYPFIFLNLVLSMLAAIQAPIIMMAQNRHLQHDRIDAGHDYEVNLKAEIEIMALHDKLDQLRNDQLGAILSRIEALAEDIRRMERGPGADA
ncbi:DUF1003 domain-containing protein [Candidimonas sp. SYP-B2681]|uniref:DUF1003 domain-containing protein n=1 Tax=Candidimonas sp. SYP-B2681 TaxID=2497686 RepID=UPI000F8653D1|nr:DUF1003 domain-containing protein [Candidimonas sp. SYP-B2681]RTZ48039.1 DUF1003 domain-containing protein [Candidimonas sp. SYP-B2681]